MKIILISWLFLILYFSGKNGVFEVSGQCLKDQKSLLLTLKSNLTTAPTNSPKLAGWKDGIDCCLWDGVACDSSGHVIKLELNNQTLSGEILNYSSLFDLKYLESLNLAWNNFYGFTIPSGLYQLTNLTYLNLSESGFSGEISRDLGNLRRLVTLDLSDRFAGYLDHHLNFENPNLKVLFKNLTKLTELHLGGVNISAPGSVWCNYLSPLSNLSVLSLAGCHLSGPIDDSLSQHSSLSVINLANNNLSASIPDFFSKFSNLTSLSLSSCNLQGMFPQKILQVPTLQNLDLSNNYLITGIISEIPKNGSLRIIDLSYTNFSGSLPDSIGYLGNLSQISLSNCNFSGPIPSTMTNLTKLVHVDFSSNIFNGSIPPFHMSQNLKYIDLSRNGLSGTIPSNHFEGLTDLSYVNLGYNFLEGEIPPSLFTLPSLQSLQLSNNKFVGQTVGIPNASTSGLSTLDLSCNLLEGSIPYSFFQLEGLHVLSLSSNRFNGSLQLKSINRLPHLTKLELSYNNLYVHVNSSNSIFPQLSALRLASCNVQYFPDLKNQSRMIYLDLSENHIAGQIPRWIWGIGQGGLQHLNLSGNLLVGMEANYSFGDLLTLDLHSNQLQGDIPMPPAEAVYVDYSGNNFTGSISPFIGSSLHFTLFFSLSHNSLTGHVPISICKAGYLQVLDLSNNALTGHIPECLVNIQSLKVLHLSTNNLNAIIPDNFHASCSLSMFDLSGNSLGGGIPRSLVNCTSLEVLNIGNNKVEDTFPCMLQNSNSLRVLVLRANLFHGNLSCTSSNSSWQNLQIVDAAQNNFSGDLSSGSISNWRGMWSLGQYEQLGQGHLSTTFLKLSKLYYQDTLMVTFKGLQMELVKSLTIFASIDLSNNNLEGGIPDTIGQLRALNSLKLSNNRLSGEIPSSVRNLTQLESLDLSSNQFTGTIPAELADLTFLSFLNLSYNHLSGRIPLGHQFATFEEVSFEGNMGLCGFPLNRSCKGDTEPIPQPSTPAGNGVDSGTKIFAALGFGVGLGMYLARRIIFPEVRVFGFTL